jgi:GNAT superfamily N-acetyltransferase
MAPVGASTPEPDLVLRRAATPSDAAAAAEVYLRARHAAVPAVPPLVHDDDDVRRWFREVVVPERETWLAEHGGAPVAVMVLDGDELDQLYVHPDRTGRGVGSRLLALAQRSRPGGLALWTFQSNLGAQRFYERHGFVAVERTDGSGNEERAPDVRYAWRPAPQGP